MVKQSEGASSIATIELNVKEYELNNYTVHDSLGGSSSLRCNTKVQYNASNSFTGLAGSRLSGAKMPVLPRGLTGLGHTLKARWLLLILTLE